MRVRMLSVLGLAVVMAALLPSSKTFLSDITFAQGCVSNPIVCENQQPGTPSSIWDISGSGDPTIQGFATQMSVDQGATIGFKVDSGGPFRIEIYRIGYYSGNGARLIATLPGTFSATSQPACISNGPTGLIDCGNWSTPASWVVPATAVSGVYIARLERTDSGGSSHIIFVVRDDDRVSDLVFQTSDTTWQAYNQYGGNSLYVGGPGTNPGRAYKVSYNRPFTTRGTTPEDFFFSAEYPLVRFLERNGFDVSYMAGVDTDRLSGTATDPLDIARHKVFLSVGHDEYWSAAQRANVEAARGTGMHLAFFSGNEIFWKTRWESSIAGPSTPYRTLVSYKETHANAKIDPLANVWTGTWRDPRFSPPADGGRPENALSGTIFTVNVPGATTSIDVSEPEGKMRLWRNTTVATLPPGGSATIGSGLLGYEWDEDLDNGSGPPGLMRLSTTTMNVGQKLQDYGSTYAAGTATHNLTLYRHASGALVFAAGTVQLTWGLDNDHDLGSNPTDVRLQQATVNLLADMGAQGLTLQGGLVAATQSSDTLAPTSTITSPAPGSSVPLGSPVTITGTAADNGGGAVALVEVSVDGGTTWQRANGRASWTFVWTPSVAGSVTLRSRGVDDSGNMETPGSGVTVTVGGAQSCPCSIWSSSTVPDRADLDTSAVEVGVKFQSDVAGYITGVRFYKFSVNTGTHVGNLWSSGGTRLANVTFTNETASGWQQAMFATPVQIAANTTYVASYHAAAGRYAVNSNYFASGVTSPPLRAPSSSQSGGNGVYQYGTSSALPTQTFNAENYWVDVVFETSLAPDTTPPTVTSTTPAGGAGGVSIDANITATFNENMDPATIGSNTFELRNSVNALVPAAVTYDGATRTATLNPTDSLALSATYTATVRGGAADPRAKDLAGNALAANHTWSFTTSATPPPPDSCPCSIWSPTTTPDRQDSDPNAIEIGVRFRASQNGYITGVRFYKYAVNTGTHVGNLWTNTGTRLANVTFTGESASGWQEALFASPVQITANTTYVASYHTPVGRYGVSSNYFASSSVTNGPLTALRDGLDGPNGVYRYGATSAFPNSTFQSENYWVDVVFVSSIGPDTTPPTVSSVTPANGLSGVSASTSVSVVFSEAMDASTISTSTIELRDPTAAPVAATVSYSSATRTATLVPSQPLSYSTTYTVFVRGGTTDPRVKDSAGNALANNFTSTFTTTAPPPPPPDQGPGGPILVIATAPNPFGRYYAEILRAEGMNEFTVTDLTQVSAATLTAYDVVILGEGILTDAQVTMFTNWVNGGGNLIAMKPDKKLAGLLGLVDAAATLTNTYLLINTGTAPGAGLVGQTIQFHGVADRYTTSGATTIAALYSNATTATVNPAVTLRSVGASGGQASAFTYDLARSIVYTRQGNPAWAGQERDGLAPIRSDDLFFGNAAGDPRPDWVDLNKIAIPQADEQQRLLAQLILHMNADRKPLPRFWYLPRGLKAVVVMTGDDHATGGTAGRFDNYKASSLPGCSVANWECIRGTSYIYSNTPLSNTQAAAYVADGFEVALHVNTNCANYTPATLPGFFSDQLANFRSVYSSVPSPTTNRTHCIVWSDWDTQADVSLANGIRLDTTYYHYPGSWIGNRTGFMTGSGMPMRFARATGEMIDVYQAHSHMTDESQQAYPATVDTLLDNALGPLGYYGVFTANMHTDNVESFGSDMILQSAVARGVPIVTARQMLDWLDRRNGSSFRSMTWSGNILFFDISAGAGANGLQAMLPTSTPFGALNGITRDGSTISFTTQTIKGVQYAVFAAQAGSYRAAYGVDAIPPAISAVAAAPAANGTADVTWTTNEASDSRVDYGTSPAALSSNVSDAALVTAHVIRLTNLTAGTTYHYRVRSADAAANAAVSPAPPDAPATFTTPPPSIAIGDVSIAEGNAGTATVTFAVTLSAPSSQTVTVSYATANGSASAADYTSTSGTLTFTSGVTTQNVLVSVTGDVLDEANETVLLNLSSAVNATIGDSQGVGTILDDDLPASLSIADASVTEGNAGTSDANFVVTLSAASGQTVTVSYATANGSATVGSDYVNTSGTLTFTAGTTSQSIPVAVIGESMNETNETFSVTLSGAANATIARSQATGTIVNDDPVPTISVADLSVQEGNSGTTNAVFTLTLSAASGQVVTVGYATAPGTATAGSDYTTASGTATFAVGVTTQTVTISVLGDTVSELDETFLLNLSAPTNATIADPQAVGTIVNDEGLPAITIGDVTVTEGNSGTTNAVFPVTLSGPSVQVITVDYATVSGTATGGSDYVAASGTLTFPAGTTSNSVTVVVNGDIVVEPNETFTVTLTNPTNATIARATGTGTITNDDGASGLVAAYNFNEASGTTVLDSSANGVLGTISGATRTAAGHTGPALTFDGINDWVTVNDAAVLDVTRVTLEAWVRPTVLSGWRTVIMKETPNALAYTLYAHDNAPRPAGYINNGGPDLDVQGTAALALNTWTHLAMTYDGANMRLYVNGALVGTRAATGLIVATANPLRIGGNAPWGEYFAGQIDDVRVYNRALTLAEIQTDMNTPVP